MTGNVLSIARFVLAMAALLIAAGFVLAAAPTPVPRITGMGYAEAKALLISRGWRPRVVCDDRKQDCRRYGLMAEIFRRRGYVEVEYCADDGPWCIFHYVDKRGRCLRLEIEGELGEGKRSRDPLKVVHLSRQCPDRT